MHIWHTVALVSAENLPSEQERQTVLLYSGKYVPAEQAVQDLS